MAYADKHVCTQQGSSKTSSSLLWFGIEVILEYGSQTFR